jgi:hypothetical protein
LYELRGINPIWIDKSNLSLADAVKQTAVQKYHLSSQNPIIKELVP